MREPDIVASTYRGQNYIEDKSKVNSETTSQGPEQRSPKRELRLQSRGNKSGAWKEGSDLPVVNTHTAFLFLG